ncbi:MAG: alanine racemase, partial [Bacteroidota bacterium]
MPVAQTLADAGADYLAVAYPDEGTELRRGGITLPMMVLNAEPYTFGRMRKDALEPVVHAVTDLRAAV